MEIRRLNILDYDGVYSLWTRTAGMGLRRLDDSREGIAKFLERNPRTNFVAEEDNAIAGVILCGHDGRRGYIYHAAVEPDRRGQGIGRSLVDHVLRALKEEGVAKAALVVFATNRIGNEFWENLEFEVRTDLIYRNKSIDPCNI